MSEPVITAHGDVISSALNVEPHEDARHQFFSETRILRGQIQKIYAVDTADNDPGNSTGTYTLYDVLVWKPDGSTEVLKRCRALQPFFGGTYNNFLEVLPTDPGPDAENQDLGSSERPGTHVLVGFIGGQKLYGPVILGALPHPGETATNTRPTEDKGVYMEGEFQGLNFKIDNDGALTITFTGPKDEEGNPVNSDIGPVTIGIDKDGVIQAQTTQQQTVTIDQKNKVIDVVNGDVEFKMEQDGNKITVTCDEFDVTANSSATFKIDGDTKINASGNLTLSGSAINLQKGENDSPSEPFVLGQQFATFMNNLLTAIQAITVTGNLGAPTSPPLNAAQFSQLQSQVNSLLSNLINGMQ